MPANIKNISKTRTEWNEILSLLVEQDQIMLFRICRKMIIYLRRIEAQEIHEVMEEFNPSVDYEKRAQSLGQNQPKPRGLPINLNEIVKKIFVIADKYLANDEITNLLKQWIRQEHMSVLSRVLERRHASQGEVMEAVQKYLKLFGPHYVHSYDEIIGLRVALINRFLSENLAFINIAKNYITIRRMAEILNRVVGPAQGNGNLGGKSAGLILARQILIDKQKVNSLLKNVKVPKSRFITADGLFDFLHYNALEEFVFTKYQTLAEIQQEYSFVEYIFKNSQFPPESLQALSMILDDMEGKPIVVRSSSILEDSFEASFMGKYKSIFLSNQGSKEQRLTNFVEAIAEVYACTFAPEPMEHRIKQKLIDFHEEMGILVQQVVGSKVGKYYLPNFSGVASSSNEFRWSNKLRREDGLIRLVVGMGTRVSGRSKGDFPCIMAPGKPGLKIIQSKKSRLKYTQNYVDVLNLETSKFETIAFKELLREGNGYIPGIENIVSYLEEGNLVDPANDERNFRRKNLVITFNKLISSSIYTSKIKAILDELSETYRRPIDIEFSSDGENLYLLQCRPRSTSEIENPIKIPGDIGEKKKIFSTNKSISNAYIDNVKYILYVDPDKYNRIDKHDTYHKIANTIKRVNSKLSEKEYILMGPGKWGIQRKHLQGVPVDFDYISNAALLVELIDDNHEHFNEPSYGSFFYQDLIESHIYYLPVYYKEPENLFNKEFFESSKNMLAEVDKRYKKYSDYIKLIRIKDFAEDGNLAVYMDGYNNTALACIINDKDKKTMDSK